MANLWKNSRAWTGDVFNILLCKELSIHKQRLEIPLNTIVAQVNAIGLPFLVDVVWTDASYDNTQNFQSSAYSTANSGALVLWRRGYDYGIPDANANTSTGAGKFIRINDVAIQRTAPDDFIYLANVIMHEILHVLGLWHSSGQNYYNDRHRHYVSITGKVTDKGKFIYGNQPLMSAGKRTPLGLNYDDVQGLKTKYDLPKGNTRTVTIHTSGSEVGLMCMTNSSYSLGADVVDGVAIIKYVKPGSYWLIIDNMKIRRFKVGVKDKEFSI